MLSIYDKVSNEGNKCTVFQLSEDLQYQLWIHKDKFTWVRLRRNGNNGVVSFSMEIPKEIASDVATELLKASDNGFFGLSPTGKFC